MMNSFLIQAESLLRQGTERDNEKKVKDEYLSELLLNITLSKINPSDDLANDKLPVFSTKKSDFQEKEKELQIWPRSRLTSSATEIFSNNNDDLVPRSKSAPNTTTEDTATKTIDEIQGRLANFSTPSSQKTENLLRKDNFDVNNDEGTTTYSIRLLRYRCCHFPLK